MKMISPTNREVDIGQTLGADEYIGMVRREVMDGFMRDRAIEKVWDIQERSYHFEDSELKEFASRKCGSARFNLFEGPPLDQAVVLPPKLRTQNISITGNLGNSIPPFQDVLYSQGQLFLFFRVPRRLTLS